MLRTHNTTKPGGFTIVELLVVIVIVGVVLALTLPAFALMRESGRRTKCLSNARQLATAVNAFSATNQSRLPENRTVVTDTTYVTWRHRFAENGWVSATDVWECPSHPDPGPRSEQGFTGTNVQCAGDVRSSYALNGHVLWRRGITDRDATRRDTVIQRPSHTILIAETNRSFADLRASEPIVANYYGDSPGPYGYWHGGRAVYAFQDGHAEVIAFLDTGNPDCRWHNGRDLSEDAFVPQTPEQTRPHDHPDWEYLVPDIYLP